MLDLFVATGLLAAFLAPHSAEAQWNPRRRVVTYRVQVPVYQYQTFQYQQPFAGRFANRANRVRQDYRSQCQQQYYYYQAPQTAYRQPVNGQRQALAVNPNLVQTPTVVKPTENNAIPEIGSLAPGDVTPGSSPASDIVLPMLEEPVINDPNLLPASGESPIDPIIDEPKIDSANKIGDSVLEKIPEKKN